MTGATVRSGLRRFEDVEVGETLPTRALPIRRLDLIRYAGASGDFNVIHWNERVACSVGLPGVIAHGMLTLAVAGRLATDWAGDPGAVVEYGAKFVKPVPVPDDDEGASLEVGGVVVALDEQARTARIDLTVSCAGAKVLGRAQAVVRLA
ncbi:MAG TPA: MaoC/PaaZ C-terminal domain-containing protein [Kineosporiaceae bacterium]